MLDDENTARRLIVDDKRAAFLKQGVSSFHTTHKDQLCVTMASCACRRGAEEDGKKRDAKAVLILPGKRSSGKDELMDGREKGY